MCSIWFFLFRYNTWKNFIRSILYYHIFACRRLVSKLFYADFHSVAGLTLPPIDTNLKKIRKVDWMINEVKSFMPHAFGFTQIIIGFRFLCPKKTPKLPSPTGRNIARCAVKNLCPRLIDATNGILSTIRPLDLEVGRSDSLKAWGSFKGNKQAWPVMTTLVLCGDSTICVLAGGRRLKAEPFARIVPLDYMIWKTLLR